MSEIEPKRGEIWRVDLEPTRGSEIKSSKGNKGDTRPVLVLSRPGVGEREVRLCAPITDFKPERDKRRFWRVTIGENETSGLSKISCADVSQTRALHISRFVRQDGKAHTAEIEASAAALAKSVGFVVPQPADE